VSEKLFTKCQICHDPVRLFRVRVSRRACELSESALKPIFCDTRSPLPSAQAFSGMSAHRSAPGHPIFCPLCSHAVAESWC